MADRAKADCGANLVERSYWLNGARFAPVARGTALSRRHAKSARGLALTDFQAAATTSPHPLVAAAKLTLSPRPSPSKRRSNESSHQRYLDVHLFILSWPENPFCKVLKQFLCENRNSRYLGLIVGSNRRLARRLAARGRGSREFLIWNRCNPLKSPDSDE
jgi:hypothetical protein